jgi:hypothetical protein
LDNNQWIKLEKNHVLNFERVSGPHSNTKGSQTMPVPMRGKDIDLLSLYGGAFRILGDDGFVNYSVTTNNCQHFVQALLKGSGLLSPELNKFILQDAPSLIKSLGLDSKLADKVTDTAAQGDILLNGNGSAKSQNGEGIIDDILEAIGLKSKPYKFSPEMQKNIDKSKREIDEQLRQP